MISESPGSRHPSISRAGVAKPLKRGKACMNCRFLKIKCDANKPICGPCRRHPKDDECEYADSPGRSRTKVLEDTVARLEARLHELENPDASSASVTLHDPYVRYNDSQSNAKSPLLIIPETQPFGPLSPFSPTSSSSSLPSGSGRHWHNFASLDAMTESTGSSGVSTSPNRRIASSPFLGTDEPSFLLIGTLLDKFLPHAYEFGFFLHPPMFRASTLLQLPFGHISRPSPALLSVVYLWGVHLSQSEALLMEEHAFLTRALQHTATDLLGAHPKRLMHTLQAEILLATYFFRTGRFIEAKSHIGAAISLALGVQLHKIRSSNYPAPSTLGLHSDSPVVLSSPADYLEEGERINGFWTVFMIHKMMSVAHELPTSVCGALEAPGIQIDTPWPLDIASYKDGVLDPSVQGNGTVRTFLGSYQYDAQDGFSTTAMLVKASILFHRASHLLGQWSPSMPPRDFHAFAAAFQSINRLIEAFQSHLIPLSQVEASDPILRTVILTHALTDAAIIKLHANFAYGDASSKQKCLAAARNMVNFGGTNLADLRHINPIMGTLWMTACHIFIDEISRVRLHNATWSPVAGDVSEEELMESLRTAITALSLFSEDSALMHYQLTKVQDAFSAI